MSSSELHKDVERMADIVLSEPDETGLDEVVCQVKNGLRISDEPELKRISLDVMREMLKRGAWADFDLGVPTGKSHPETTPDEIIARIDREWTALGRRPTIGDICQFQWTLAAMEAYEKSKLDSPPP
jgi:hypothetical protein